MGRTGPKVSSVMIFISWVTSVMTVGGMTEAAVHCARALEVADQLPEDHPSVRETWLTVGRHQLARGDRDAGRRMLERAHGAFVAAVGPDHPSVAEVLLVLASDARETGDRRDEHARLTQILAVYRRHAGPDTRGR